MRRKAILAAYAAGASASLFSGGLSGFQFNNATGLCGQSLEDANITGVYSYNPHVAQFKQKGQPDNDAGSTLPVQWAVTVQEVSDVQNASVQWSLWYSTLGANYSYDFALGYDVCAFAMETPSLDMLYRAQNDDGDCLTAMDQTCVSDLQDQARKEAYDLTLDPETQLPRANLTRDSVYEVCSQVRKNLYDNFPRSCEIFFNHTDPLSVSGGALTGYNYSYLYQGCTITNDSNSNVYHHVATYTKYTLDNPVIAKNYYNGLSIFTQPVLTVFMPIANANAPASITRAVSKLQCVRAKDVMSGSEKLEAVPTPTPLYAGKGLSGGAIAGIVVGVVVGLALIGGAAWFLFRRRRKQIQKGEKTDSEEKEKFAGEEQGAQMLGADEQKRPIEAGGTQIAELNSHEAGQRAELAGENRPVSEKDARQPPSELVGDVPRSPR